MQAYQLYQRNTCRLRRGGEKVVVSVHGLSMAAFQFANLAAVASIVSMEAATQWSATGFNCLTSFSPSQRLSAALHRASLSGASTVVKRPSC